MRVLLIGNYGTGNLGDEALREYFLTRFPEVEWTVVSAHPTDPNEVPRLPGGIRSFLQFSWLRTLVAFIKTEAVVFGGGSLFTDIETPYACFLWWLHAAIARVFGKPVHFAFQGIGPLRTPLGRFFARRALRHAATISVRDEASLQYATGATLSFDPVFLLLQGYRKAAEQRNTLAIIPRWNSGVAFRGKVRESLARHSFDQVQILCLQGDAQELAYAANLRTLVPDAAVCTVDTLQELAMRVGESSLVISERYHGALTAIALGIPCVIVPQGEADKLSSLLPFVSAIEHQREKLRDLVQKGEKNLQHHLMNP